MWALRSKSVLWIGFLVLVSGCNGRTAPDASPSPPGPSESPLEQSPSISPSPSPTAQGRVVHISVQGREVSPDLDRVEVTIGEKLRIEIEVDRNEELHVHAYNHRLQVKAGEVGVLEFVADIPGTFEVELEKSKIELFQLVVR